MYISLRTSLSSPISNLSSRLSSNSPPQILAPHCTAAPRRSSPSRPPSPLPPPLRTLSKPAFICATVMLFRSGSVVHTVLLYAPRRRAPTKLPHPIVPTAHCCHLHVRLSVLPLLFLVAALPLAFHVAFLRVCPYASSCP